MKIALFGGSFDPPHLGHDAAIKAALERLDADKLIIMPTFISPFKSEFSAPPLLRLKWANEAWGALAKVCVSDYEIAQNRPVPTIQSVRHMRQIYGECEIYLIIGADHLASLDKWHEIDELFRLATFVVASRDDVAVPENFKILNINAPVSSSQIRQNLDKSLMIPCIADEAAKFYQGKTCKKESNESSKS